MAGLFDFGGGGGGSNVMCCFGGWCGGCYCYSCGADCSEYVDTAACNPVLCSSCMTGAVCCYVPCTPELGSGTAICTPCGPQCQYVCCAGYWPCSPNSCGSTDQPPLECAMYAGMDGNGNEIYQLEDGSLVYGDGSAATQGDIACNEGSCKGTPCNPFGHVTPGSGAAPRGGNSGSGSAPPSAGGGKPAGSPPSKSATNCQQTKLTAAMSKLGSTITSLLSGGKKVPAKKVLPGQVATASTLGMSPNTFLLVIIVVGGLLLWMAFGHKPQGD